MFLSLDEPGRSGGAGGRGSGTRVLAETAGLHRFGMPEVVARDVPYAHMLTAANLLRGLSYRLFTEHGEWLSAEGRTGAREVPARRILDGDDVLRFWGVRPDGAGEVPVRLARGRSGCHGCGAALETLPPQGCDPARWWDEHAGAALPKLAWA